MSRESKLIVFVAVLASLLEIVDASIVNVAIPSMMGNLGATIEDISMVVTGYAIANAIVLPLSSWLSERIGRRRYYLGCIIAFTLTSVACGLAPNLYTLIVFRIFQGVAGGALLPTSQALIYEQFPKEKAGIAGAIFGMSVMIGPALGPTLGGYLTDQFGWRSIFNVNLPLGMLALMVGIAVVRNREDAPTANPVSAGQATPDKKPTPSAKPKGAIDLFGLVMLALGIGCLQFVLERGQADDWFASGTIVLTTVTSAVCLPTFVWWELKIKHPIINLRLFADPIVRNGVMLMTMLGFFLYAVIFILPVFVTSMFHYDATQTGMLFIPGSILTAMLMPFVGRQLAKRDPRTLIFIGLIAIEIFVYKMTQFTPQTSRSQIINALYLRGFAMAFMFVPINSSILSQFKGVELGQVSGLLNLSRQIGGSIGIALVATLLTMNSHQNFLDITSHVSMLEPATRQFVAQIQGSAATRMSEFAGSATVQQTVLRALNGRIQQQVFMLSFVQLMNMVGLIFLLAFIPAFLLKLRTRAKAVSDAH